MFWSTRHYNKIPKSLLHGKILEIGARDGKPQLESVHKDVFLSPDYLGIDLIDYSPGLNIIQADALDYDYPVETYDTIISVATLEHIGFEYWEILLSKWKKALKAGGRMVIIVPDNELLNTHLMNDYSVARQQNKLHGQYIGHRVFSITPRVFKYFLGNDIEIKRVRKPLIFRNSGESFSWGVLRFVKRLITGNRYVWHFLLRKKDILMVIYTKTE